MAVRVVLHLPFLTQYALLDRPSTSGTGSLTEQDGPAALSFDLDQRSGSQDDLILQRYSDELRLELQRHLPRRIFTFRLAGPIRACQRQNR